MTTLTKVNGAVLKWGRERARLTRDAVAKSLGASVDEVDHWEQNRSQLTVTKALEFAKAVHIPFGYLFLSAPPRQKLPIPDLRRRGGAVPQTLSVNFIDVLHNVTLKQQWFRQFRVDEGASPLGLVGKFTTETDPSVVANDIRITLGLDAEARREAKGAADLLRLLASRSEELGILVMRSGVVGSNNNRKLSVAEFSGFVMSDDFAPVVFINVNDSSTAQVFTCVHELAHIWIGKSGISELNVEPTRRDMLDVEAYCNAVSAEVLVPAMEFRDEWGSRPRNFSALASHFRVSQQVVLKRAHELQVIPEEEFFRRWRDLPKTPGSAKQKSGGNFHTTLPARNSVRFTTTILSEVRSGRVLHRDASRLLGVKPSTLPKLARIRLGE